MNRIVLAIILVLSTLSAPPARAGYCIDALDSLISWLTPKKKVRFAWEINNLDVEFISTDEVRKLYNIKLAILDSLKQIDHSPWMQEIKAAIESGDPVRISEVAQRFSKSRHLASLMRSHFRFSARLLRLQSEMQRPLGILKDWQAQLQSYRTLALGDWKILGLLKLKIRSVEYDIEQIETILALIEKFRIYHPDNRPSDSASKEDILYVYLVYPELHRNAWLTRNYLNYYQSDIEINPRKAYEWLAQNAYIR